VTGHADTEFNMWQAVPGGAWRRLTLLARLRLRSGSAAVSPPAVGSGHSVRLLPSSSKASRRAHASSAAPGTASGPVSWFSPRSMHEMPRARARRRLLTGVV